MPCFHLLRRALSLLMLMRAMLRAMPKMLLMSMLMLI